MEPSPQPSRRSRRRWLQFGLSHLLLVTLLAAVLLGWYRQRISQWVDALWTGPAENDTRDANKLGVELLTRLHPRSVVTDFLELKRQGKHAEADKLLSPKASATIQRAGFAAVDAIAASSLRHEFTKPADQEVDIDVFVETTCTYAEPAEGRLTVIWGLRPNDWRDQTPDWRIRVISLSSSDGNVVRRWLLNLENEETLRRWKGWSLPSALAGDGGVVFAPRKPHNERTQESQRMEPSPRAQRRSRRPRLQFSLLQLLLLTLLAAVFLAWQREPVLQLDRVAVACAGRCRVGRCHGESVADDRDSGHYRRSGPRRRIRRR